MYGTILGARKGTPIAAIRGEVEASLVSTRNMRARINLAHSIWNGKNEMVKEVLRRMRNEKSNPWIRRLNLYLKNRNQLRTNGRNEKRTNSKEDIKI